MPSDRYSDHDHHDRNLSRDRDHSGPPIDPRKLVVFGLSDRVNEDDLDHAFSKYGALECVALKPGKGGYSSGIAFVDFENSKDAEEAMADKHGSELDGSTIRVEVSRPRVKGPEKKGDYKGYKDWYGGKGYDKGYSDYYCGKSSKGKGNYYHSWGKSAPSWVYEKGIGGPWDSYGYGKGKSSYKGGGPSYYYKGTFSKSSRKDSRERDRNRSCKSRSRSAKSGEKSPRSVADKSPGGKSSKSNNGNDDDDPDKKVNNKRSSKSPKTSKSPKSPRSPKSRDRSRSPGHSKGGYYESSGYYMKGSGYKGYKDSYKGDYYKGSGYKGGYKDSDYKGYKGDYKGSDYKGSYSKGGYKDGQGLRDDYYKVKVRNMPISASWQDLKDFLRACGDVKYTNIVESGIGVGGYLSSKEQRDCVLDLDGTKMMARNGETSYVTVEIFRDSDPGDDSSNPFNTDGPGRARSLSRGAKNVGRSPSRGRGRSPSRSR